MQRSLEGAADEVGAGPCDLGVERFEAGKLQPDIRSDLEIEVGGCPEAMRRKIDDLDRHSACTPLAKTGAQFNMGALGLAAMIDELRRKVTRKIDWVAVGVQHKFLASCEGPRVRSVSRKSDADTCSPEAGKLSLLLREAAVQGGSPAG